MGVVWIRYENETKDRLISLLGNVFDGRKEALISLLRERDRRDNGHIGFDPAKVLGEFMRYCAADVSGVDVQGVIVTEGASGFSVVRVDGVAVIQYAKGCLYSPCEAVSPDHLGAEHYKAEGDHFETVDAALAYAKRILPKPSVGEIEIDPNQVLDRLPLEVSPPSVRGTGVFAEDDASFFKRFAGLLGEPPNSTSPPTKSAPPDPALAAVTYVKSLRAPSASAGEFKVWNVLVVGGKQYTVQVEWGRQGTRLRRALRGTFVNRHAAVQAAEKLYEKKQKKSPGYHPWVPTF